MPSSEEVMIEQVFINDELAFLKKERELFRDYEGEFLLEHKLSESGAVAFRGLLFKPTMKTTVPDLC